LKEVEQLSSERAQTDSIQNDVRVYFLAQLFSELIVSIEQNSTASQPERQGKATAIQSTLEKLSKELNFPSILCKSLLIATEDAPTSGSSRSSSLSSLLQYLSRGTALNNVGVITFTTSICAGWEHLSVDSSLIVDLATRVLIPCLEKEEDLSKLPAALIQTVKFALLSSKNSSTENILRKFEQIRFQPLMSTPSKSTAERLSPASAGLITNMLAEVGPACTQNVTTLRDTLIQITNSYPSASRMSTPIDELKMARLIHFFSDKGSRQINESGALANDATGGSEWNLDNVSKVLKDDYRHLNYDLVAKQCDFEGFLIRDDKHFRVFLKLYTIIALQPFPGGAVTTRWTNTIGQCSFLAFALTSPPSLFSFPLTEDEQNDAAVATTSNSSEVNASGWASKFVFEAMLEFSEYPSLLPRVRDIFVKALMNCPEVVLCALARRSTDSGSRRTQMEEQLKNDLLPYYFNPEKQSGRNPTLVMRRLWSLSPNFLIDACIQEWRQGQDKPPQARLALANHIINIIKCLPSPEKDMIAILKSSSYDFSVGLAFVLADQDLLVPHAWLEERFRTGGIEFAVGLMTYIYKNIRSAAPRAKDISAPLLSLESVAVALNFLTSLPGPSLAQTIPGQDPNNPNSQTLDQLVKQLSDTCLKSSSLQGVLEKMRSAGSSTHPSIEDEANTYFSKIYTSEEHIDEVIATLKRFKTSGDQRESDIFACMIHNLFDEYRFFSKYPEKELRITGIFFGKLIKHQLVTSITLGIALRYVLEALRKSPGEGTQNNSGKMFRFGMFALEQFLDRLHEWPQYCSHIVQISHLKDGYKSLVQEIEGAMAESQNRTSSGVSIGSAVNDSASVSSNRVINSVPSSVNVPSTDRNTIMKSDSLETKKVVKFGIGLGRAVSGKEVSEVHETPPDNILDRVQLIINNVTMQNVEQKANDLKNLMEPQYFGWLGQYLVVKRISTQPNYHPTYMALLEHLGDYGKGLIDAILSSVYINVGKLLLSENITTSTKERSLLKNLGSWLGQITLSRNKPILQITLDCKELLYQGYETGMLIAVTPFVARILEGAKSSVVFRPPNPWLMGLLGVFRALYEVEDLKMNIKFEVEVLCKNLGVKLEDIPLRTEDLAKRGVPNKTGNLDFNIKSSSSSQSQPVANESKARSNSATSSATVPQQIGSTAPSSAVPVKDQQTTIPNLASYVSINASLSQMTQQLVASGTGANLDDNVLKRSVPVAVDRAIREIIQPVVERSVNIACITTKEIVVKDFAMESDENKMREAAQLMVANLSGSLALVTCREPLRSSVSTHLRQLLISAATGNSAESTSPQLGDALQSFIDQCVSICAADNLDLGCMLIEKAAMEKAVRDIDESLASDLSTRKRHRETTGSPFYNMSIFGSGTYPSALPDPLRPKPGGLRNDQLLVYKAFQRSPRSLSQPVTSDSGSVSTTRFSAETLSSYAQKLDITVTSLLTAAGARAPEITLDRIPADHEIKQILSATKKMAASFTTPLTQTESDSALSFGQTIFKRLYELRLSEPLRLEAFVDLLSALGMCCQQLTKELGTWSTYAPTETEPQRKLHRTVLLLLLRSKLLQVSMLDKYLFEQVTHEQNHGGKVEWREFSIALIRTAVHEKIINPKELPRTMSLLSSLGKSGGQSSQLAQVLRSIDEMRDRESTDMKTPQSSRISMSATSLANLSSATKRALESIHSISSKDPPNFKQQVIIMVKGWVRLVTEGGSEEDMIQFVRILQQQVIGQSEEQNERFFRVSTEVLIESALESAVIGENKSQTKLNYLFIDGYSKLVLMLMKHLSATGNADDIAKQRVNLLNQILGVIMRSMMAHYERAKITSKGGVPNWDQRPWFRLVLNLIMDLNAPSPLFDPISYGILSVFGTALHIVQPLVIPGFAFAWLELVSHRMFLPNLLSLKGQKGWPIAHQLLIDLFLFLEPHLRKIDLSESMKHLYKGTMRVLLVLLHDYPAFLSAYHLSFCNVIPENCVQFRNLVLSAFPRGLVLPDPFTPNLKIDLLPEISDSPIILSNVVGPISSLRDDLDKYLSTRQPAEFLATLPARLYREGSKDIDSARMNSLVLYLGMQSIVRQQSKNSQFLPQSPEMDVLLKLLDFDDAGRYILLNAIANQLRFPSSHTHFFSCVTLFLFSEAKDEGVREQITRVLLERLIVHRPHPWGLLVTFIELIKNQRYQFWDHSFTRCASEIEKVFESVARSCLTPSSQKVTSIGSTGIA
jgi:CCR4-NOT transcription complex subunit 1